MGGSPDDRRPLHDLLGLSRDVGVDELRYAYEQAVGRATRAGDYRHARTLSRAYDRMPLADREMLFDRPRRIALARDRPAGPVKPERRAPRRRRRPFRRGMLSAIRATLAVGAVVGVSIFTVLRLGPHDQRQPTTYPPPHPARSAAIDTPAPRSDVGPTIQIPITARTGANGLVTVLCQPSSGAAGYYLTAPPGTLIACANGALPRVLP